jgi:hypothetical protein
MAVICAGAGFLIGVVVLSESWHLSPNWGDAPTWVLVGLGALGGWATLRQLRLFQEQFKEDAERNDQRDKFLELQLTRY